MASRRDNKQPPQPPARRIYHRTLEEVMRTSMLPYAEFVIMERALPRGI